MKKEAIIELGRKILKEGKIPYYTLGALIGIPDIKYCNARYMRPKNGDTILYRFGDRFALVIRRSEILIKTNENALYKFDGTKEDSLCGYAAIILSDLYRIKASEEKKSEVIKELQDILMNLDGYYEDLSGVVKLPRKTLVENELEINESNSSYIPFKNGAEYTIKINDSRTRYKIMVSGDNREHVCCGIDIDTAVDNLTENELRVIRFGGVIKELARIITGNTTVTPVRFSDTEKLLQECGLNKEDVLDQFFTEKITSLDKPINYLNGGEGIYNVNGDISISHKGILYTPKVSVRLSEVKDHISYLLLAAYAVLNNDPDWEIAYLISIQENFSKQNYFAKMAEFLGRDITVKENYLLEEGWKAICDAVDLGVADKYVAYKTMMMETIGIIDSVPTVNNNETETAHEW